METLPPILHAHVAAIIMQYSYDSCCVCGRGLVHWRHAPCSEECLDSYLGRGLDAMMSAAAPAPTGQGSRPRGRQRR